MECMDEKCGIVVEKGNIKGLVEAINKVEMNGFDKKNILQRARKFNKNNKFNEYVKLYR
jgi:hypothetical protein